MAIYRSDYLLFCSAGLLGYVLISDRIRVVCLRLADHHGVSHVCFLVWGAASDVGCDQADDQAGYLEPEQFRD